MTRPSRSLPADYFETMFRGTDDPWDLETSAYEQDKFARSIDALSTRTYLNGFEIGCAKGVLTEKVAPHCAALLAVDVSETALRAARERCASLPQIRFECLTFPRDAPADRFDLAILSEVAYYWDDEDLARTGNWLKTHVLPGGDLLLVHYTGDTDYPQSADEAVAKLFASLETSVIVVQAEREPRYRLDLWRRHL